MPFPFADRLREKVRPAVVVSRPECEAESGMIWLAMITGTGAPPLPGDIMLSDLPAAGLWKTSRVRTSKVSSLSPARVLTRLGALAQKDAAEVRAAVRAWLA